MTTSLAFGQGNNPLVGIWAMDEGWQTVEWLFRSDGRYQLDKRSADPDAGFSTTERGRYELSGQVLTIAPYEYFGEPYRKGYSVELNGGTLTLTTLGDFPVMDLFQFKPGSREDVEARENVTREMVGAWRRRIVFWGDEELTFRPGGYYFRKDIPESGNQPPDFIRGRYDRKENRLALKPYSGTEATREIDFFGNTLTLIRSDGTSGDAATYERVPGSAAEVQAKAADAEAFLSRADWQVGVWQITSAGFVGELTIRPDGHYYATNEVEILRGLVRGRYTIEPRRIHFAPFVGQALYSRSNGDFGNVERTREFDYWDGELQLIDLDALSQSVMLARKVPGSEATVKERVLQAQAVRAQDGWHLGIWKVSDPVGWMEFTLRPDGRYIAKAGTGTAPSEVERGRYVINADKATLAPYPGQGSMQSRGFELDLYDGDLFLIGDTRRMVVARKIAGSETEVIAKTLEPAAMKGERGGILGLWTANLPGRSAELVLRPDGQFRLRHCTGGSVSWDYGLYSVDMAARTLIYDSRYVPVQTQGLDFYGDTLTIFGGLGAPSTYTVNLGIVDAAIADSLATDAQEAQTDAQWLARVPIAPRDPNATHLPAGDIPADPSPGRTYEASTVFGAYQLYRRLISGFVYFNDLGEIRAVPVTNTREWHFFPTGRVLVRFKNYSAGPVYPTPVLTVSDSWGAYRIDPKPELDDVLHRYADNALFMETDLGEQLEMTLEDGRRHLFWGKDYLIQSEWATEQKPVPCQPAEPADATLMNVGVSLTTAITPDETGDAAPLRVQINGPISGSITLSGTSQTAATLVVERTAGLAVPRVWNPVLTNTVAAGPFRMSIPQGEHPLGFFRVRWGR